MHRQRACDRRCRRPPLRLTLHQAVRKLRCSSTQEEREQFKAATVLTSRQMKVFNEMHDAKLASNRVLVRSLRETPPQPKALK
jgi:hypothetical protein